jgi:hypothetical protein
VLAGALTKRKATPLAIEDSMVSSLDVQPTREDRWDRFVIVLGFRDWRIIGSSDWNAKRMVGWWLSSSGAELEEAVMDGIDGAIPAP